MKGEGILDENKIKASFAGKLAHYRKSAGLTQSQLAEKLNYSDKAVSKWERGESVPDVFVLSQIAELFSVRVDDLINEKVPERPIDIVRNHGLITLISVGLVFFIAAIVFSTLGVVGFAGFPLWMCFIYAMPVASIVLIVFTAMWWGKIKLALSISSLLWTLLLCFLLSFDTLKVATYVVAVLIMQIIVVLFFMIRFKRNKK